ncbi:hypothetical protein P3T39_003006 [Kitasatospora sp. GP82]|nr:hypothetical protein [Kitasatospora sp. GP82]
MTIVIWSQLWALREPAADGYPDSELLSVLLAKADAGNARSHLANAIQGALLIFSGASAAEQGSKRDRQNPEK